jgi:type I site-specific restriction endonuclease
MAGLLGRLGKLEGTVVAGEAAAIADARTATQAVAARSQYSYTRAEEINKNFGNPPYTPGTQVVEFSTGQMENYVRFTSNPAKPDGEWFVRAEDIKGLTATNSEQIRVADLHG